MTPTTVIQVTTDGQLELPPEIRSRLQPGDEFVLWEDKDIIVLKKLEKPLRDEIVKQENSRFFEIADRLAGLNQIAPISEEEIQQEIQAYKQEKRNLT
ncbi:MAG: hypothetical protein SXA11_15445 [Cyanobacteriota bacterium]|nr:hypothetical protein [Cyanobacteriota bacterium]